MLRLVGGAMLGAGTYCFMVYTRPVLIASDVRDSVIRVDGEPVLQGTGSILFYPWRWEYTVEVNTLRQVVRGRIYPWEHDSDSGSVIVDKSGVSFNLIWRATSGGGTTDR